MAADPAIEVILAAIDRGYDRKSWHGTNLKGSLRGVPAELAAWRPAPGRHNVWELAVHAAYWKYTVRRRITGERRGSFALEGSNFFERPEPGRATEAAWKEDRSLLDAEHRRLRAAVASLTAGDLERRPPGGRTTFLDLLTGIAAHDLYHAGQIQLLKRLAIANETVIEQLWLDQAERRLENHRAGRAEGIAADEVLREAEDSLR